MIDQKLVDVLPPTQAAMLRIATPDLKSTELGAHAGVRGCIPTLQVLVANPLLCQHDVKGVNGLLQTLEAAWPRGSDAWKAPRATEEPFSYFVVRWGMRLDLNWLLARLARAIALDYKRRWATIGQPNVLRQPEAYTLARACCLLILGVTRLSNAILASDRELVELPIRQLSDGETGLKRGYLSSLALGALRVAPRRRAFASKVLALEQLELVPAREHRHAETAPSEWAG